MSTCCSWARRSFRRRTSTPSILVSMAVTATPSRCPSTPRTTSRWHARCRLHLHIYIYIHIHIHIHVHIHIHRETLTTEKALFPSKPCNTYCVNCGVFHFLDYYDYPGTLNPKPYELNLKPQASGCFALLGRSLGPIFPVSCTSGSTFFCAVQKR